MIWHFEYTSLIWPLLASTAFMAVLGIYTCRRWTIPAAGPTSLLLLFAAGWSLCSALRTASSDLTTAVFWFQALVLCSLPIPVVSLAFALQYSGRRHWLTRQRLALLGVIPAVTFLLIVTNNLHGLMWSRLWLDDGQVLFEPGLWSWVFALYFFLLVSLHLVVVAGVFVRSQGLLRWQSGTILLAWFLPLVAQMIVVAIDNPLKPLDLVVLAFNFTGLAYALAIFRFQMLDLLPIAQGAISEKLHDGIMVLDLQNRLIDVNPAAQKLLGLYASQVIGREATQVLESWPHLIKLLNDSGARQAEIQFGNATAPQYYDVSVSPLADFRDFELGRLIILHDITESRQAQELHLEQQRTIAALRERERLGMELHDGLSQALNFINVQAQAASEMIARGKSDQACAYLNRLVAVAQDAQTDTRELITSRSSPTAHREEFFLALNRHLKQFSLDCGIHTELVVPHELGSITFEPAVEAQLLRIIQEALANVREHARARNVSISFTSGIDYVQVVVKDDGIGFDPAKLDGNGKNFGLRIMQNRALEVGGQMQFSTAPQEGTQVIVQVPWHKEAGKDASTSIIS